MKLNELVPCFSGEIINGSTSPCLDRDISGIVGDSRAVEPGNIFIVVPCAQAQDHALMAANAGAGALIVEPDMAALLHGKTDIPLISVTSARRALSQAAAMAYPRQPAYNVAVTGTNGKSSVVHFTRQIWQHLGHAAASIGTLGVELTPNARPENKVAFSELTTPDAFTFHQILDTLAASHINHCAFEASSHGLDQYRCHEVRLAAAGFTNLTQDHLDYHGTMDAYFDAKARLFWEVLPAGKAAVLNAGSSYFNALQAICAGRGQQIISYGVEVEAGLQALNLRLSSGQVLFDLKMGAEMWKDIPVHLVGTFQVENVLCAIGLALACGVSAAEIVKILPELRSAPGRMELVGKTSAGNPVFIDYAHTPDALSRALRSLRSHVTKAGRLIVVFGCGGNRDAGKRAQMGEAAQTLADYAYVTDDNPRDEDPAFIRAQVMVGCRGGHEIAGRGQAIKTAITSLNPDDVLLIAGRGDERVQVIGNRTLAFEDRVEVLKYLQADLMAGGKTAP